MRILVPVKRVVDFNVRPQVRADGSGVELANVRMSMNPFDEIALEAAVRLKEAGKATEVVALSIGPAAARETLRAALAVGADRATLIETEAAIEPLAVAKLIAAVATAEQVDLVIAGKQAIDDDMGAVGPMLGGLLDWPQATFASALEVADGALRVVRETDQGLQTLRMSLPAVVTADLRLNTPRHATLPNIMKARSRPLTEKTIADFDVDIAPRLEVITTRAPEARKAGVRLSSVGELVDRLTREGVL